MRTLDALLVFLVLGCAGLTAQGTSNRDGSLERSFRRGTPIVLESPGPRGPNKVVFEDDGETGYFYALDLSRPEQSQIVDAIAIYAVATVQRAAKADTVRVQWAADGGKAALFLNGRAEAVFDFDQKRGYARSASPMPAGSPWPRSDHSWDNRALVGIR